MAALKLTEEQKAAFEGAVKRDVSMPPGWIEELRAYLVDGKQPGGFLHAVLTNDLRGAIANGHALLAEHYDRFLGLVGESVPEAAQGTADKVKAWVQAHQKAEKVGA